MRLDVFLLTHFPEESRSLIQMWIKTGAVTSIPATILKASHKVRTHEMFTIHIPEPIPAQPQAVKIDFDIVYEDSDILVLNKPAGLVVHPAAGHYNDTLVNGLLYHCKDLSGIGGVLRPGIVHRLDKDTSGLMVVAKHDKAHNGLADQFQDKGTENGLSRQYIGFTWGMPHHTAGDIKTHIARDPHNRQKMAVVESGGKYAHTYYETLESYGNNIPIDQRITKIKFTLYTGRTHQIRVHCLHNKLPMIGDPLYGKSATKARKNIWSDDIINFHRQALHASHLSFTHPINGNFLSFDAQTPKDMQALEKDIINNSQ
ncbi:MAG TPA: RNA pseudouridine synthase [Holosporales bacterium]|nr:RNA pseudouridine synthase [Holosporales bacterium]